MSFFGRFALFILCLLCLSAYPAENKVYSDTVRLDLKSAEQRFLDQNLDLLIAKSNIDQANALLLQSKLWDNPQVSLDRELYNHDTKKFLSTNSNTQFDLQFTQLITTAGKYFKQIHINKETVQLNEFQFYDLLRTLKLGLRQNFYNLLMNQQKLAVTQEGMAELSKLTEAMQIQVDKGNVAMKELVRLQSLMLGYANNQTGILNDIADNESEIKKLLNYTANEYIIPIPDSTAVLPAKIEALTFDSLESTALQNRYHLLQANLQTNIGKDSWTLQKMKGVPDLQLGLDYDRYGSAFPSYLGLVVGIPLPLWNFNQGNIKAARFQYQQYQLQQQSKQLEIHNDLMSAYAQLLNQEKLYQSADKHFNDSFNTIYKNTYNSYKNHTIGLLEFLDYFDSYRDTKFTLLEIENQLLKQAQQINFETGKDVL